MSRKQEDSEVATVRVDPMNHPGERGARLWFLIMQSSVLKAVHQEGWWLIEMAKELERRVDACDATDAERKIFRKAYNEFHAKSSEH